MDEQKVGTETFFHRKKSVATIYYSLSKRGEQLFLLINFRRESLFTYNYRDSEWGSREQGTFAQKPLGAGNTSPKTTGNRELS